MEPKKVLIRSAIVGLPEHVRRLLAERGLCGRVRLVADGDDDAEVLLADPNLAKAVVDEPRGRSVRWVQSTWAGVNSMFLGPAAVCNREFVLTRADGMFGRAMSEYVFAHILWRERGLDHARSCQASQVYGDTAHFRTLRRLSDLTLGVLGCGAIGAKVCETARVFGMQTIGLTRRPRDPGAPAPPFAATQTAEQVFEASDYVVNLLPETEATRQFVTLELLQAGAAGAARRGEGPPVFINVGRGSVVDENVVVAALDAGLLSRAVLDVFPEEPLPQGSPLWRHPLVTVTPHVAALTTASDIATLFADNLERYVEQKPVHHVVDWSVGY
ncbi:Glyoxylate/hydroxypyruvate reductase A [Diplonema papillatum]|nr:Glyoxylate/hydroxypyruvate reductase A [Diplonema papillatum]